MKIKRAKGNNGRRARQKLQKQIEMLLLAFVTLIMIGLYFFFFGGRGRSLPSEESLMSLNNYIKRKDKLFDADIQKILDAEYNLVGIYANRDFDKDNDDSYSGIIGQFCKLNFDAHKESPNEVPLFRDLLAESPGCTEPYETDLQSLATESRMFDAIIQKHNDNVHQQQGHSSYPQEKLLTPKVLNLTGAVFHESKCGSTLVANTLIGMDPERNRVYSESAPPIYALVKLCDAMFKCAPGLSSRILKDIIYMMSRSNNSNEDRVFFKLQATASWHIQDFRIAFPTVPWIFVYREPVEVITSHFKMGEEHANCLKYKNRPAHRYINEVAVRYQNNKKTTDNLSIEEFCAVHLTSFTENAVRQLKDSRRLVGSHGKAVGHAINYDDLPTIMYETVLPDLWGVPMNQEHIDNIIDVSMKYEKSRLEEEKQQPRKKDSEAKKRATALKIKDAANRIMGSSFLALEKFNHQMIVGHTMK